MLSGISVDLDAQKGISDIIISSLDFMQSFAQQVLGICPESVFSGTRPYGSCRFDEPRHSNKGSSTIFRCFRSSLCR